MKKPELKRLYLFRHGETDWNRQWRFQGHTDIPLNARGREQAAGLAGPLGRLGIEAFITSDLSRARETAEIVAGAMGHPRTMIRVHPGLREACLGQAEGKTPSEIERAFGPDILKRWKSIGPTDADVHYPGGESGSAVLERVFAALESFVLQEDFKIAAVATHGGVIRRAIHSLLPHGTPPVPIPNGILYLIEAEVGARRDGGNVRWSAPLVFPILKV